MRRLLLVRHAATIATRAFAFGCDEPLDERGLRAAAALRLSVPTGHDVLCSPAARCLQTVESAGLGSPTREPSLAGCDIGSWAGLTLEALSTSDPDGLSAWRTQPASRPHGGESLETFSARIAGWLDGQSRLDGSAVAITHGDVVRAAVIHALDAPIDAFWRIDVAPLGVTELHAHGGRWTVTRVNAAPGSRAEARA